MTFNHVISLCRQDGFLGYALYLDFNNACSLQGLGASAVKFRLSVNGQQQETLTIRSKQTCHTIGTHGGGGVNMDTAPVFLDLKVFYRVIWSKTPTLARGKQTKNRIGSFSHDTNVGTKTAGNVWFAETKSVTSVQGTWECRVQTESLLSSKCWCK